MRNRGREWERDQRPIPWRRMRAGGSLSHRREGCRAVKEMWAKPKPNQSPPTDLQWVIERNRRKTRGAQWVPMEGPNTETGKQRLGEERRLGESLRMTGKGTRRQRLQGAA